MAKKSKLAKNQKRKELVEFYADRRAELTSIIKDPNASYDEKRIAYQKIAKMPRYAQRPLATAIAVACQAGLVPTSVSSACLASRYGNTRIVVSFPVSERHPGNADRPTLQTC